MPVCSVSSDNHFITRESCGGEPSECAPISDTYCIHIIPVAPVRRKIVKVPTENQFRKALLVFGRSEKVLSLFILNFHYASLKTPRFLEAPFGV